MENYKLTIEDGVITWVENADENGNPIEGILYIPKEAVAFHPDAWIFLGCDADGIVVDEENPVPSSARAIGVLAFMIHTVTCPKESNVSSYCNKYEITEVK